MATIGLDMLHYAPITEDANGNETYGKPVPIKQAISANMTINTVNTPIEADGDCVDTVSVFDSGKLAINTADLHKTAIAALLGTKLDSNGVLISSKEDKPSPVAIGFRARKSNGSYALVWFYRVVFALPSSDRATKEDSINYSTEKIEGVIYRRNRTDESGRHPWKAETTDSTLSLEPIQQTVLDTLSTSEKLSTGYHANHIETSDSWFNRVYEPNYTSENTTNAESTIRNTDIS